MQTVAVGVIFGEGKAEVREELRYWWGNRHAS
jgi:hypothetical protein